MEVKQDETFNVQIIREKPHEGFTFFLFLLNTVELDKTFSLQEVKEIIKLNSKFYVNALDLKKKKYFYLGKMTMFAFLLSFANNSDFSQDIA